MDKEDCVICMDGSYDKKYTLPCNHKFHYVCIKKWIEKNPSCPCCRRHIEKIAEEKNVDVSNIYGDLGIKLLTNIGIIAVYGLEYLLCKTVDKEYRGIGDYLSNIIKSGTGQELIRDLV